MQDEEKASNFLDDVGATPIRKNGYQKQTGDDERILLNVGGVRHETHVSTLRTIPNTRLARLAEYHVLSDKKDEYFFDRHPAVFNSVIDFYRTGELHVPLEVCGAVVKRELDFWQISELHIKSCCWRHYRSYIENKRILDSFNKSLKKEQIYINLDDYEGWRRFQMKVWLILEHPRTSRKAMIYGVISLLFVVTSILGFTLETLPQLQPTRNYTKTNQTIDCNGEKKQLVQIMTQHPALEKLDLICTVFFTIELIVRFIFAPNKLGFVRSMMNIIDLLALVPLYMQLIFSTSEMRSCYMNEQFIIQIMFILRIARMFRIFHLVKHYQALKILIYALKASVQELFMLAIFLLIGMLVFASIIYYAELQDLTTPGEKFTTIPMGFWWALITMTTVGYGDVYPVTVYGYVVGACCAVSGVLMIALTIPVISNNFTLFYTHVRSRGSDSDGSQNSGSQDTLSLPSYAEGGCDHTIEDRKPSNGSLVLETYMNGTSVLRKISYKKKQHKYSPMGFIAESNSMSNLPSQREENDFEMTRTNSNKARSDDGVTYDRGSINDICESNSYHKS
ncbi:potassium voltage-gated channel subfamily C member 2-like [Mytilus trossulus]|uniref:potassium voltage-gated channel subfamily C member 2-like n=1 Tax=Mytilus trossulus TaxID=6551 RepID=UPI0030053926